MECYAVVVLQDTHATGSCICPCGKRATECSSCEVRKILARETTGWAVAKKRYVVRTSMVPEQILETPIGLRTGEAT